MSSSHLSKSTLCLSAVIFSAGLVACGGSSDPTPAPATKWSGTVIGSYFRNALVCFDVNANSKCDVGEPSSRTDSKGVFTLTGNASGVVAEIGPDAKEYDPDTKLESAVGSRIVLRAPKEAMGIVSAHSTAVVAEMESNKLSFADAVAKVAIAAGVSGSKLLTDFNTESNVSVKATLQSESNELIKRIQSMLATASSTDDVRTVLITASATARYYQTKLPYRAQQDISTYEAAPADFTPVYTQLVARHGSRGLSSFKYDLAVTNMFKQAEADGAVTALGKTLGPDVLKIMKANFLLGYGVDGISKVGYGNETQVGINEHTQLAARMLQRLPTFWKQIGDTANGSNPRQIVTVTSGVDRAVDSGYFFTKSLKATQPNLSALITYPPAPAPYPDTGTAVAQPAGTNRFLLYFHKLVKATDAVTKTTDPLYATYQSSQAYQAYADDVDQLAKQSGLLSTASAKAAGRAVMERLFTKAFVDKLDAGTYKFANTGTATYTSDDGKFTSTLTGDGKTKIASSVDAGNILYELYVISPALQKEAGVDFTQYMPVEQAKVFAFINDASDFYSKGPGITEKGDMTYRMAKILQDDVFGEMDNIAKGNTTHAAKLRFAHAEIIIPFASQMGLKTVLQQVPLASTYSYENNSWRGEYVSPMAANMQIDMYKDGAGKMWVKMLYNEKETDFKTACDSAKRSVSSKFYDYTALRSCYGYSAL